MTSLRMIRRFYPAFLVLLLLVLGPVSAGANRIFFPIISEDFKAGAWVTVQSEDFEGAFPGTSWELVDANNINSPNFLWAKRNCRPHGGQNSGWGVGGGASGTGLACGSNYPNNVDSWMITKEFSLAGATDAVVAFYLWQNTDPTVPNQDTVCRLASIDNVNFWGTCSFGSTAGWTRVTLDLKNVPTLGNISNAPRVWVALRFFSNASVNLAEGAYVDDILIRKCVGGGCGVPDAPLLADAPVQSPLVEKAAYFRRPSN
jgi:hypothetical protein